ncbi:DUF7178 family protein [Mycolicibacterium aichiense]|uniref:Uncharacterized protein n=1 Tax=Mycolicibacterium aichiense TaxID=1799 RepID=A0AAD1HQG4_9MYCO|nr:hypothetical protein [Mycolicibacterium aichiense]MCV7016739.1 hypothetical protein [Mycolicibacterium aichiense]QFG08053.1 hypothetical protein SEA_HERBERTWM_87 [Mycobacterium phage Herbertwm]BBX09479.1 hypothetical protein MAIC_42820 [Mycolicibacterium aichiense]SUA14044.1 Uncharacterised protein [Mycolicibacterium aichiense]
MATALQLSHDEVLRLRAGVTLRTVTKRIMDVYRVASDADILAGKGWYDEARRVARELAEEAGISVTAAAAVIAHLSPRCPWERNISMAQELVRTGTTKGLYGNIAKARLAMIVDDPWSTFGDGPKTKAFAANIIGDDHAVTVDVWASRIAGINEQQLGRVGVYEAVAHAYRLAAKRVGITPAEMQAITWVVVRGSAN